MIILGTNSIKDTGYDVANSCRFNGGSSDSLNRTLGTPTNNKKYTISTWVKKTKNSGNVNGNAQSLMGTIGGDDTYFEFNGSTDQLFFGEYSSSAWQIEIKTNRVLRDVSAWYHIVLAVDTTQGTESNRVKLYINGVQETSLAQTNYPSQNFNTKLNSASNHYISNNGNIGGAYAAYLEGYLSEYCLIDGTALDPTSFGEFDEDSGIWKPIDVSGLTFGTNGFYLDFEDSSALGNDAAGSNNFTVNNLTAIDQSTDTCTNNFATLNPLDRANGTTAIVSDGNLTLAHSGGTNGSHTMLKSTLAVSKGKWYSEYKQTVNGGTNRFGIIDIAQINYPTSTNPYVGSFSGGYAYQSDGNKENNNVDSSYGNSYSSGDIIGVAFDSDNGNIWFSKNGTWQNSATISEIEAGTTTNAAFTGIDTSKNYGFASSPYNNGAGTHNFGSPPYAISSGNTDGNGYGNFEYAVPSGYYSLNTKNLAEYG